MHVRLTSVNKKKLSVALSICNYWGNTVMNKFKKLILVLSVFVPMLSSNSFNVENSFNIDMNIIGPMILINSTINII